MSRPEIQGHREVAEAVITAALVAVATEAVSWLFERLKRRGEWAEIVE